MHSALSCVHDGWCEERKTSIEREKIDCTCRVCRCDEKRKDFLCSMLCVNAGIVGVSGGWIMMRKQKEKNNFFHF